MKNKKHDNFGKKATKAVRKKNHLPAVILIISLLLFCYCMAAMFFRTHYFPHTTINGVNCSMKTEQQAKDLILAQTSQYQLQIVGRDQLAATIQAADVDLKFSFDQTFDQIRQNQNPFLWGVESFGKQDYQLTQAASYDAAKLSQVLAQAQVLNRADAKAPVDASISAYQEGTNDYQIVKEEEGTTLDNDKTIEAVGHAVTAMKTKVDLDQASCYTEPKLRATDQTITDTAAALNKCVSAKITYDWNTHQEIVEKQQIASWIKVTGTSYQFDEESIKKWLANCAYKYDTYGKTRSFKTVSGEVKSIPSGGYGWRTDRKAELLKLEENIKNGDVVSREPVYSHTAAQKGDNDIGSSYVEINLTAQHLYLFEEGKIVFESDFVSGNVSKGNGTPAGVFGITYKEKNATLKGENYTTPVNYWMPFNGNIGMHDAVWRSQFGGDIYLTSGSHGCVNLPLASAKTMFSYMKEGFPVVCYY